MSTLLMVAVLVVLIMLAALLWSSLNDRFVKLEKQIDDLRTEILFLRGEMDLSRHEWESDRH